MTNSFVVNISICFDYLTKLENIDTSNNDNQTLYRQKMQFHKNIWNDELRDDISMMFD